MDEIGELTLEAKNEKLKVITAKLKEQLVLRDYLKSLIGEDVKADKDFCVP